MDQSLLDFYRHIIDDKFELKIVELIEQGIEDDNILKILLKIMEGDLSD